MDIELVASLGRSTVLMDGVELTSDGISDYWDGSFAGFSWGYNGAGPTHLAFAVLYKSMGDKELAFRLTRWFREEVVSKWKPWEPWGQDMHVECDVAGWVEKNKDAFPDD